MRAEIYSTLEILLHLNQSPFRRNAIGKGAETRNTVQYSQDLVITLKSVHTGISLVVLLFKQIHLNGMKRTGGF